MSKSYRRGGDDRFEARRRRNEQRRNNSPKREWREQDSRFELRGSLSHMQDNSSNRL